MKDKINNQFGNVLLYALLTISAILSTAIVISNLITSNIKQTGLISNTQAAFYAAESGAERFLYQIRKEDQLPIMGDCGLKNINCNWEIDQTAIRELNLDLEQNQTVQIDFFDTNNLQKASGVESLSLEWSQGNGSWLELSNINWDSQGTIIWAEYPLQPSYKMLYSGGLAIDNSFQHEKSYRVRIKALYGPAENLKIKLFDADNANDNSVPFPNFLKVKINGAYRESNQIVNIDTSRYSPTLGLFDYVLFSEARLEK